MNQIKTKAFRIKTAQAHAGLGDLPAVKYIALGTGGVSAGLPKNLSGSETKLYNEVFRTECIKEIENETTVKYNFKIDSVRDGLVNQKINEIALFDETGTENLNTGTMVYMQTRTDILINSTDTIDFVVYLEF